MSQNLRWCCCEGTLNDCCEMQSCSGFVAPTQITITYSGTVTRTWSTGQSAVIATYTYTIQSDSAFTQRGNNCTADSPREFGCPTATLTYNYNGYEYQPQDIVGEDYRSGHVPCGGCDANFLCDLDIVYCLYQTANFYGTSRVVNGSGSPLFGSGCCQPRVTNDSVLRLLCCESCKCVRPAVMYTPAVTLWFTANDFYTITPGCCNTDVGGSGPGTWIMPRFQILGKCGCPDATTWSQANIVTDCAPPDYICAGGSICCGPLSCSGLPTGVISTGAEAWSWQCQSDSGDPLNPIINFCEVTVGYTDVCNQTLTVTIT